MNHPKSEKLTIARGGSARQLAGIIQEKDPAVLSAMLQNPNMSARLLIQLLRRKSLNETHLNTIAGNRVWLKDYNLKLELVLYVRTPRHLAIKFIQDLMLRDLALIARKVSVHPTLRDVAVNYLKVRLESMRLGEKILLARTGPIAFMPSLLGDKDSRIFRAALRNYRLTEDDLQAFVASASCSAEKLDLVLEDSRWSCNPRIMKLLATHRNLSYSSRRVVLQKVTLPLLLELIDSPMLDENHRLLAQFTVKQRIGMLSLKEKKILAGSPSRKLLYYLGITMQDEDVMEAWLRNPRVNRTMRLKVMKRNRAVTVRNRLRRDTELSDPGKMMPADDT
ncbi:hypothetical protein JW823_05850 [bacterium]|nr:hypothetical protein [candidate division CSSED10-310 bacterium]